MFKFFRKQSKNQKGFTLVELMVVVVIIGILVAIAVPVYSKMTENAKNKTCEANIRTLQGAVNVYYAEKGEYPGIAGESSELIDAGLIDEVPECPLDGDYSVENGVVKCNHVVSGEEEDED